jgi:hypothetical protein
LINDQLDGNLAGQQIETQNQANIEGSTNYQ